MSQKSSHSRFQLRIPRARNIRIIKISLSRAAESLIFPFTRARRNGREYFISVCKVNHAADFLFAFFSAGNTSAHIFRCRCGCDGQLGAAPLTRKEFSSPPPFRSTTVACKIWPTHTLSLPHFFSQEKRIRIRIHGPADFSPTAVVKKSSFLSFPFMCGQHKDASCLASKVEGRPQSICRVIGFQESRVNRPRRTTGKIFFFS